MLLVTPIPSAISGTPALSNASPRGRGEKPTCGTSRRPGPLPVRCSPAWPSLPCVVRACSVLADCFVALVNLYHVNTPGWRTSLDEDASVDSSMYPVTPNRNPLAADGRHPPLARCRWGGPGSLELGEGIRTVAPERTGTRGSAGAMRKMRPSEGAGTVVSASAVSLDPARRDSSRGVSGRLSRPRRART